MKTPDQIVADVARRLRNTWHLDAAGGQDQPPRWPHSVALGATPRTTLETRFEQVQKAAFGLRDWADTNGVTLADTARLVHGTSQRIPTHVTVPTVEVATRLAGPDWVARLRRGRDRAAALRRDFRHVGDLARIVRDVDTYSDVDFDLLCTAARWFSEHSAAGLTPRQVPIPGLQAKWLNAHHGTVAALAGLPGLNLLPPHPARVHFTYLDPDHRAAGRRRHDSATVGDPVELGYPPRIVVISENKDTALHFPELPGGICVEGGGRGGSTHASFSWLRECPHLFYWGDMDAAGFEILNGFREAGLHVTGILMDVPTYDTYQQFGTDTDARGTPLPVPPRRPLPYLAAAEQELYDRLTDPAWSGYRRIEQERIPLDHALRALCEHLPVG